MQTIALVDVQKNFLDAVSLVKRSPLSLIHDGDVIAVLVSPDLFAKAMHALEEFEDIEIFDHAIAANEETFSWNPNE